jgi:hypothetical protein
MTHILRGLRSSAVIAVWTLLSAGVSIAATWTAPASQLAARIAEIAAPGTLHITYRDASALTTAQLQDFTRELETALRGRGLRLVTANAGIEVTVTASESARTIVFVAQVQAGRETKTAVVSAPKEMTTGVPTGGASVTLHKSLLVEQDEPILDVLAMNGGGQLIALTPSRVIAFGRKGEQWDTQSTFEMQQTRAWSRDPRGRLFPAADHALDAYLPGLVCASQTLTPLVMSCRAADDPWPLSDKQAAFYNGVRNYFNGVTSPAIAGNTVAFYTAVALPRSNGLAWVLNGVDGRIHLSEGNQTVAVRTNSGVRDWGSDIASMNGCGRGPLIIASGTNDSAAPDTLRAYEVPGSEPVAVSAAIDLPGPVTALWQQADQRSVTAVVHSLATGKYDAYAISATCNQ